MTKFRHLLFFFLLNIAILPFSSAMDAYAQGSLHRKTKPVPQKATVKKTTQKTIQKTESIPAYENNIGTERKLSTLYIGIPMQNCVNYSGRQVKPEQWTVKLSNEGNGSVRTYSGLTPNLVLYEESPEPTSALDKDLRDLYYVKINIPETMAGKNMVEVTNSLFDFDSDCNAKDGSISLITHTPGKQITLYTVVDPSSPIPGTNTYFSADKWTVTVKNKNGRTAVFKNIPVVALNSGKRDRLKDDTKKDLAGKYYSTFVLPSTFEGDNELILTTPYGSWTTQLKDLESNTTVTNFFYMNSIKR